MTITFEQLNKICDNALGREYNPDVRLEFLRIARITSSCLDLSLLLPEYREKIEEEIPKIETKAYQMDEKYEVEGILNVLKLKYLRYLEYSENISNKLNKLFDLLSSKYNYSDDLNTQLKLKINRFKEFLSSYRTTPEFEQDIYDRIFKLSENIKKDDANDARYLLIVELRNMLALQ